MITQGREGQGWRPYGFGMQHGPDSQSAETRMQSLPSCDCCNVEVRSRADHRDPLPTPQLEGLIEREAPGCLPGAAGQGGARRGKAGQGRAGRGTAGQGRARQVRARQGSAGHGVAGQLPDFVTLHRTPVDSTGLRRTPRDSAGLRWTPRDSVGLCRIPRDSAGLSGILLIL